MEGGRWGKVEGKTKMRLNESLRPAMAGIGAARTVAKLLGGERRTAVSIAGGAPWPDGEVALQNVVQILLFGRQVRHDLVDLRGDDFPHRWMS